MKNRFVRLATAPAAAMATVTRAGDLHVRRLGRTQQLAELKSLPELTTYTRMPGDYV